MLFRKDSHWLVTNVDADGDRYLMAYDTSSDAQEVLMGASSIFDFVLPALFASIKEQLITADLQGQTTMWDAETLRPTRKVAWPKAIRHWPSKRGLAPTCSKRGRPWFT